MMTLKTSELVIYAVFICLFRRSWLGAATPRWPSLLFHWNMNGIHLSLPHCRRASIMSVFLVCQDTTGTEGSEDAFLHTHTHTPSHVVHYVDIQSAVHIPPVCVFVFTGQTFLTPLLHRSLTRIFTVFAQVQSHSLPQSGCSALIIKEGAAASGAEMSASRRVRVQLQATK